MAGIFSAVAAADALIRSVLSVQNDSSANNVQKEYAKLRKKLPAFQTDGSITKFLSGFIVEPVIIMSKDARNTEVADKLAVLNTDIFASFYLQAFHALTSMHGLDANIAVTLLGTDNSSMFGVLVDKGMGFEIGKEEKDYFKDLADKPKNKYLTFSCEAKSEYEILEDILNNQIDKLDVLKICNDDQHNYIVNTILDTIALEYPRFNNGRTPSDFSKVKKAFKDATKDRLTNTKGLDKDAFEKVCNMLLVDPKKYTGKYGSDDEVKVQKIIKTASIGYNTDTVIKSQAENLYYINHRDLSVKVDMITKDHMTRTLVIPITIKTNIIVTHFDNIINMLKPNDRTKKFSYRLDEYKAGAISLRELLFCGDLIKSYKKNKLKDKEGLLDIIKKREESANSKLISTGEMVGFEKYYNMLIVTADEKVLLSKHIGGDILNEKYKQELLSQAHALTLSVIDPDYERVYILTKDIRGKSDVTFKAIAKKSNKESDTADILKAMMANRPPVF